MITGHHHTNDSLRKMQEAFRGNRTSERRIVYLDYGANEIRVWANYRYRRYKSINRRVFLKSIRRKA